MLKIKTFAKSITFSLITFIYAVSVNAQSCPSQITSFPYLENFENGLGLWSQATDDNFDWTRQSGPTPNAGTGPSVAAEGNFYLYTNSGLNSPWRNSGIISPCIDLTNQGGGVLSFSYHMKGSTMGWIELVASTNNGTTWTKIWGAGGREYGDIWIQHQLDISAYAGQRVKFKFVATMNSQPTSDIGIDEFSLTSIPKYQSPSLSNENYIFTRTYQTPQTSNTNLKANRDVIEEVTYIDGLGRPKQHVAIKASPVDQKDIITHIDYDQFGRKIKDWLPYQEVIGTTGSYRGDVSGKTQQFYQNKFPNDFTLLSTQDINSYSEKSFEASPLNRLLEQGAPGKDWKVFPNDNTDHTIKFNYQTNKINEIRLYNVQLDQHFKPTLINTNNVFYSAGELYKIITKDENWKSGKNHTTEEFTDKQGKTLVKRSYADTDLNGDGDFADPGEAEAIYDTYYVYDDYGNLTFVLPPKSEPTSSNVSLNQDKIIHLSYQYRYDSRNRLVEKQIPGKEKEFIIYNNLDQPIMTQDGNQRIKVSKEWLFTKYDAFGRIAYTGKIIDNRSREIIQAEANTYNSNQWVERGPEITLAGIKVYYNNGAYPAAINEILTVNYYDNYNFPALLQGIPMDTESWGVPLSNNVKGLLTFTHSKVLETTSYIRTAIKYDVKGRQTWSRSMNDYLQTHHFSALKLDFTGKVTESYTSQSKNGGTPVVYIDYFTYDHMGRLKKQLQVLKDYGFPLEVIAENTYDELGQLTGKGVGNVQGRNRLQVIDYTYNVRGWLKQINNPTSLGADLFAFKINYNTTEMGVSGVQPLFNGNISETIWRTANTQDSYSQRKRGYGFQYDHLNRLTSAQFRRGNSTGSLFDEQLNDYNVTGITFDKNGNIGKLNRRGVVNSSNGIGDMDKLDYFYYPNSNKLMAVQELTGGSGGYGYVNGSTAATEYSYDPNGNLTSDANKNITAITYNHLNLPKSVNIGGGTINYTYDATGIKQRKTTGSTITDYVENYIYQGNSLQFFNHPEGYAENNAGTFKYHYQYKDHLGNVRLTYADLNNNGAIDPSSEILDEKNYYPFGLEHKGYNNVLRGTENNHFTYNGKELEKELGLEWTDYGARRYMRDLGRWTTIDPAAQEYVGISSYSYAANNPNVFTDPDGKRLFFVGGANNDQDGWNYITRWGNFMTDAGIRNFVRVNASNGRMGDILFTSNYRNSGYTYRINHPRNPMDDRLIRPNDVERVPRQHNAIDRAVGQIKGNLADTPLEEGEQFNLAGYSYGSVLQAQVALKLANDGQYIDNLILIGSPISDDSDLYKQLSGNDNIGNILRVDIEGDLLSNPNDILEFINGGIQNRDSPNNGTGPHFDLARPGQEANSLIQTVIQWLKDQGVE